VGFELLSLLSPPSTLSLSPATAAPGQPRLSQLTSSALSMSSSGTSDSTRTQHAYPPRQPARDAQTPPPPNKISAYYSLVLPDFTYYVQTLSVTIGRRCTPSSLATSSDRPQADVDLGPLKNVSRLHAKIEYDDDEERFVLIVIGRNGAWVDGVWANSGSRVALGERYARFSCRLRASEQQY
jgi:hypothetical protein